MKIKLAKDEGRIIGELILSIAITLLLYLLAISVSGDDYSGVIICTGLAMMLAGLIGMMAIRCDKYRRDCQFEQYSNKSATNAYYSTLFRLKEAGGQLSGREIEELRDWAGDIDTLN